MTRLVRAELMKLATTRLIWVFTLAMVAANAVMVAFVIRSAGRVGAAPLGSAEGLRAMLPVPALLMTVLGALAAAGEFRHGTAVAAVLVEPRRGRVLLAKLAAIALAGGVLLVVAVTGDLVVALGWLTSEGVSVDLFNREVGLALVAGVVAMPVYGMVGVGVGTLIRNPIAAVIVPLFWTQAVEPVIAASGGRALVRWMITGADAALTRQPFPGLVPPWAGGLLLFGYATLFALAGGWTLIHRDLA